MARTYPPREPREFLDYLRRASTPHIAEIAAISEPVGEINTYRQDGTLLRRWEEQASLPDRLLVVGDAVVSLNPIYGQGMTLAAAAGATLQHGLDSSASLDELARHIQRQLAEIVNDAFRLTAAADASFAGAEWSEDYAPPSPDEAAFAHAIGVLSTQTPAVAKRVAEATDYIRPAELRQPDLVTAATTWLGGTRDVPPFDPREFPPSVHAVGEEGAHA
ncbi:hypothetical protein KL864_27565 [Mycolicibacterium goodii]|uniref:hypothetical protein n=1 Tax=Mycolicibacterium goodii TaxID=134601 RepID=UPI001BDD1C94|nr:hypothetical protein [Mycolicibacterium goodii]MBU8819650.1 hypothetical protein [Mycolicibacterium goodii]